MRLTPEQMRTISTTINAVVKAQSSRYFNSEVNTVGRSYVVSEQIAASVRVALVDAGFDPQFVYEEVDATESIRAQMLEDGYKLPMVDIVDR